MHQLYEMIKKKLYGPEIFVEIDTGGVEFLNALGGIEFLLQPKSLLAVLVAR